MPAAQVGYPHAPGPAEAFTFPADFISEAIDQTRGWFYSLLAINTLVFGETPYKHVVCLGHIIDADGRKMSKSLGNIIDPWTILDTRGADACAGGCSARARRGRRRAPAWRPSTPPCATCC
jgi:isoleucyl-tRNA synthetase